MPTPTGGERRIDGSWRESNTNLEAVGERHQSQAKRRVCVVVVQRTGITDNASAKSVGAVTLLESIGTR